MGPQSSPRLLSNLSAQNIFACKKIQKIWRGFLARRRLWRWGGKLMVSRVLKIQRVMRGFRGRQKAFAQLQRFRGNCANKIKGSYFIWQAKKQLRILRAEFAQQRVLKLQCMYRMHLARAKVRAARLKFHNYMALKIGRVGRGYLGRRRMKALRARSRQIFQQMTTTIMRDIYLVTHGTKITLETLTLAPPLPPTLMASLAPTDDANVSSEWILLDSALFNLLGTNRRDFALDIATEIVRKYPDFLIGRFMLQCALLLTWTCSGKNEFVRHDFLEELVGLMFEANSNGDSNKSFESHMQSMPRELTADRTSFLRSSLEEIELMYFRNAFVRHGKNAAVALSSMAACVLMRIPFARFGEDPEEEKHHRLAIERARRLLARSKLVNTSNMGESLSRLEVLENIFATKHHVMGEADKSFTRCRMIGHDAFLQLNSAVANSLKDALSASLEVVRCGEMVVIRARSCSFPLAPKDLVLMRNRNKVDPLVEMAPKWVMEFESSAAGGDDQKTVMPSAVIQVRPLVLHNLEVTQLTHLAVKAEATKSRISEEEVCEKGQTNALLAEYLLKEVRLVTCRSRLDSQKVDLSSLRVMIPALEYKRKEMNSVRTTDYSLKLMQRVFRGYRGKARFRRLRVRSNEIKRQQELLLKRRLELEKLRIWRHKMASKIQARVRNFLFRRWISRLHRAARKIQCAVRMRQARLSVAKIRRRKLMGPEVVEMLRRGVTVGGLDFTLIIYRCGDNYRMAGHDMVRNAVYEGSLHRQDVIRLVEDYNSKLNPKQLATGKAKKLYLDSHHRVAEHIASQLGLATAITALTTPLGALVPGNKKLSLVVLPTANPSIRSVEEVTNLNRVLKDQASVVDHYNKLLIARENMKSGKVLSASARFASIGK